MLALFNLLKLKGYTQRSHSLLVDMSQIHVRNIFLFSFGLSMFRQMFGENIYCQRDGISLLQSYVDAKCFINGSFTQLEDGTILYHNYFQWIPVFFLLMALSFYLPFRVWSQYYQYYLNELTNNVAHVKDCSRVLAIISKSKGNGLFWKTWGLEVVYGVHLAVHVCLTDVFFKRALSKNVGWDILFPENASCDKSYITGGGDSTFRITCLFTISHLYRQTFIVLHVMTIALGAFHVLNFMYRLAMVVKIGIGYVNYWWCLRVAIGEAETWNAKHLLNEWRDQRRKFTNEEEYMEMNVMTN